MTSKYIFHEGERERRDRKKEAESERERARREKFFEVFSTSNK